MEEKGEELKGEDESIQGGVWSWGAGTEGQLATGRPDDENLPQFLPSLSSALPISQIACGGAHAISITRNGSVLTWGRGRSGQLGHGVSENRFLPKFVEALHSTVIVSVSAGWNHSGFISDMGCLYTCGDGSLGQLGHGDYKSQNLPQSVQFFRSKHVAQISCGMRHSLVLLEGPIREQVYAFGSTRHGQLGVAVENGCRSFNLPQLVNGFGDHINMICANGFQNAALSVEGRLYTWGRGFGEESKLFTPWLLSPDLSFSQIALGWNHALLSTSTGDLFMLGSARHAKLTGTDLTSMESGAYVDGIPCMYNLTALYGLKVKLVAAGAEHSVLLSESGEIMTWGWGDHGQLGLGSTCDQASPQVVQIRSGNISIHEIQDFLRQWLYFCCCFHDLLLAASQAFCIALPIMVCLSAKIIGSDQLMLLPFFFFCLDAVDRQTSTG